MKKYLLKESELNYIIKKTVLRLIKENTSSEIEEKAKQVYEIGQENPDGFTIYTDTLEPREGGYTVALKATQDSFGMEGALFATKYAVENNVPYIGGWLEKGQYYFDATVVIEDEQEAIRFGYQQKQLAIFDLNTYQGIKLTKEGPIRMVDPEDESTWENIEFDMSSINNLDECNASKTTINEILLPEPTYTFIIDEIAKELGPKSRVCAMLKWGLKDKEINHDPELLRQHFTNVLKSNRVYDQFKHLLYALEESVKKQIVKNCVNKYLQENMINEIGAEAVSQAVHARNKMPKSFKDMARNRNSIASDALKSYMKPFIDEKIAYTFSGNRRGGRIKDVKFNRDIVTIEMDNHDILKINVHDNTARIGNAPLEIITRPIFYKIIKAHKALMDADVKHGKKATEKYGAEVI